MRFERNESARENRIALYEAINNNSDIKSSQKSLEGKVIEPIRKDHFLGLVIDIKTYFNRSPADSADTTKIASGHFFPLI